LLAGRCGRANIKKKKQGPSRNWISNGFCCVTCSKRRMVLDPIDCVEIIAMTGACVSSMTGGWRHLGYSDQVNFRSCSLCFMLQLLMRSVFKHTVKPERHIDWEPTDSSPRTKPERYKFRMIPERDSSSLYHVHDIPLVNMYSCRT